MPLRRSSRLLAALTATLVLATVGVGVSAPSAQAVTRGDVLAVTSGRVVSTASGIGTAQSPLTPGAPRTISLASRFGSSPTPVHSVAMTITVRNAATAGQLTAGAAGGPMSLVMNYPAGGGTTSTIVPLGSDLGFVLASTSSVDVDADLQGLFLPDSMDIITDGGYAPIPGTRVFDTTTGLGTPKARLASGSTTKVSLDGNSFASAAFVNITVTNPTGAAGVINPFTTDPNSAGLPFSAKPVTSFGVIVPLMSRGFTMKLTSAAPVDVSVDVQGYYAGNAAPGFTTASGVIANTTTIAANQTVTIPVGGVAGLPRVSAGLAAASLLLQAQSATGTAASLRAWPAGTTEPTTTALSIPTGTTTPVSALATIGVGTTDAIQVKNVSGAAVQVVVQVQGYSAK